MGNTKTRFTQLSCKCIGTATGYCISHRHGTCRKQFPATGRRRCSHNVDLVSHPSSCRQWWLRKQAGESSEEFHKEGWCFVSFFGCLGWGRGRGWLVFLLLFKDCLVFLIKNWKKSCFMGFGCPLSHAKELQQQAASPLFSRHKTFAPTYIAFRRS